MEKSLEALARWARKASVELIVSARSRPGTGRRSKNRCARTGRLVVVQEDTENCSVGQMIISNSRAGGAMGGDDQPTVLVSKGTS